MKNIQLENAKKDLCVVCEQPIQIHTTWVCGQCLKQCEIDKADVKSKCCGADAQSIGRLTCSEKCHDTFVKKLEKEFGAVKMVIDDTTGMAYKVPTKDIIERGLTWQDLHKYPQLEEPAIN